jgi:hypothetical protein
VEGTLPSSLLASVHGQCPGWSEEFGLIYFPPLTKVYFDVMEFYRFFTTFHNLRRKWSVQFLSPSTLNRFIHVNIIVKGGEYFNSSVSFPVSMFQEISGFLKED